MRFSLATIGIFVIILVGGVQTLAAPLAEIRSDGQGGLSNDLTLRALKNKATVVGSGLQVLKVAPKKVKAPTKTTTKKTTKPASV
uniref:Uncharacterized protein n=1 Tax=Mycena chlorophos TaxID=658473 RepID=A0ABQ0LDQ8_MYCCL|nr:predicted protein [Mycena chlorophos]